MPHPILALTFAVLPLSAAAGTAHVARVVAPRMIHVHDGDTFYVGRQAFRLRGIDTPERGQPRAYEARCRLIELLRSGPVTIVRRADDSYGRVVADVFVDGRNVADILTAEGLAKPGRPAKAEVSFLRPSRPGVGARNRGTVCRGVGAR